LKTFKKNYALKLELIDKFYFVLFFITRIEFYRTEYFHKKIM